MISRPDQVWLWTCDDDHFGSSSRLVLLPSAKFTCFSLMHDHFYPFLPLFTQIVFFNHFFIFSICSPTSFSPSFTCSRSCATLKTLERTRDSSSSWVCPNARANLVAYRCNKWLFTFPLFYSGHCPWKVKRSFVRVFFYAFLYVLFKNKI